MAHRSFYSPPEATSPPFSPLCLWIHGLFPAIEFVVAPSSPLPNFGDPGATLARACLNSGDLTAIERSDAASRTFVSPVCFSPSDSDRTARTAGYRFAHARLTCPGLPVSATHSNPLGPPLDPLGLARTPLDPPPSDLDRTVRTPSDPCSCLFPSSAGTTRSRVVPHLSLTLPGLPVSARPPARAPSTADLISTVGFRSYG
jgi:hypothetical protein